MSKFVQPEEIDHNKNDQPLEQEKELSLNELMAKLSKEVSPTKIGVDKHTNRNSPKGYCYLIKMDSIKQ